MEHARRQVKSPGERQISLCSQQRSRCTACCTLLETKLLLLLLLLMSREMRMKRQSADISLRGRRKEEKGEREGCRCLWRRVPIHLAHGHIDHVDYHHVVVLLLLLLPVIKHTFESNQTHGYLSEMCTSTHTVSAYAEPT